MKSNRITLERAIQGFWLEKQRNVSKNTFNDYNLTFRRFQEFCGASTRFTTIDSDKVRKFLNHLRNHHRQAPKTVANAWIALSSLWTWAEVELETPHVIRGRVERPRFRRPPIEGYSRTEVAAMLEACNMAAGYKTKTGKATSHKRPTALRDRAIIVTLVETGIRATELADLIVGDFDENKGRLYIRSGKGDKKRFVYLGAAGKRHIWRYLNQRENLRPEQPLFASQNMTHMERTSLLNMIKSTAHRAGVLGKVNVHRFRHTFAINFLRNGGNMLQLQNVLGHEKMDTVRIYAQLAELDLEQAQAKASPADNWGL